VSDTLKEWCAVSVLWWRDPKKRWPLIVLLVTAILISLALSGCVWMSQILFAVCGLAVSAFYGYFAIQIFTEGKEEPPVRVLHQMWFNFLGCAVGWLAAYYFFFHRMISSDPVGVTDILLVLAAVVGMTGHLPMCVITIPATLTKLMLRWLEERTEKSRNENHKRPADKQ
jgi:hypothetical protein